MPQLDRMKEQEIVTGLQVMSLCSGFFGRITQVSEPTKDLKKDITVTWNHHGTTNIPVGERYNVQVLYLP